MSALLIYLKQTYIIERVWSDIYQATLSIIP